MPHLKKVIVVTVPTNVELNPEQLDTEQLGKVLQTIQRLSGATRLLPANKLGAFSFEASEGLYQYARSSFTQLNGIVLTTARTIAREEEEYFFLSMLELGQVIGEYELVLNTSISSLQDDLLALQAELSLVNEINSIIPED
jgi:hypothetical protein